MLKKLFTILLLFVFVQSYCQENYEMTFGYYDPSIADSSEFYSNLLTDCYIVNSGQDTIFTEIRLMIVVNPEQGDYIAREMLSISFENGIGLNPGDSVQFPAQNEDMQGVLQDITYDVVLPANNYYDGDNIIVVWPVLGGNFSFSSEQYSHDLFVNDPSSINDKTVSEIKVLVSNSFINVESNYTINQLQLYNLEGKLISESISNRLLRNKLKNGIYVLKISQNDRVFSRAIFIN
jgi:hypothetical protein